jgi:hypothetical protein
MKIIFAYIGAICLLLLSVFLFTRPAIFGAFQLKDHGALGDAVNGLTAPVIALISAGLLFYSFQAQVKANKLLQAQWQFDTYYKLFAEIDDRFKKMEITVTHSRTVGMNQTRPVTESHKAVGYLKFVKDNAGSDPQTVATWLTDITFLLEDICVLIEYVHDSGLQDKKFFTMRIKRFYNTFLKDSLSELNNLLDKKQNLYFNYFYAHFKIESLMEYILIKESGDLMTAVRESFEKRMKDGNTQQ